MKHLYKTRFKNMAQKFVPIIFIENGEIKIADENGVEYAPLLEAQKASLLKKDKMFKFYATLAFVAFNCAVSPLFIEHFNNLHSIFFAVVTFILASCAFCNRLNHSDLSGWNSCHVAEFNRAKKILQSEIMEMEKELARHASSLKEIGLQTKFNFKKPQEMTV